MNLLNDVSHSVPISLHTCATRAVANGLAKESAFFAISFVLYAIPDIFMQFMPEDLI